MSYHLSYFQPTSAHSKEIFSCSPQQAQAYCNFIVFVSKKLPAGLVLKEQNMRPEGDQDRRATFRQVFEGQNRTLVIKQFLYDWAPPAYDCPCLWRNPKIATMQEAPAPHATFIHNHALWFGKNYRKQKAATIEIERTRVEITFEKGPFSEREIIALCESFTPVDTEVRQHILQTPFSFLSYYARYIEKVISVPTGYWKHKRVESFFYFPLLQEDIPVDFTPMIDALHKRGYFFNSQFACGPNKETLVERELLFEHQTAKGSFIRLLYTPKDSMHAIPFPPLISEQECISNKQKEHLYYAHAKNFTHGPHEIACTIGSYHCILLIKPAPWTSPSWVQELMSI